MIKFNVFNNRERRVYSNNEIAKNNNYFSMGNYIDYIDDYDTEFSQELRFSNSFLQNKDKAIIEKEECKKRMIDFHNYVR